MTFLSSSVRWLRSGMGGREGRLEVMVAILTCPTVPPQKGPRKMRPASQKTQVWNELSCLYVHVDLRMNVSDMPQSAVI